MSASVDPRVTEPGRVVADVSRDFLPGLVARHPGVDWELAGGSLEERETLSNLIVGAMLALFAIYALLAIPLGSYAQPLVIMAVIPFGIIGAIAGHLVMGLAVSIVSLLGCVALAGVVVNDSLIMVDFVNDAVARGRSRAEAAVEAGALRFRAITLTSMTTFLGLVPMLLETSVPAQVMVPMAVSLAFGIVFATVITLVLVPCLYVIGDDLGRWFGVAGGASRRSARAPA